MPRAVSTDVWRRIRPKIQQWESVTGRKASSTQLQAWIEAELSVEAGRATQERALDIQEAAVESRTAFQKEQIALGKEQRESAERAATLTGVAQIVQTGAYAYDKGIFGKAYSGAKAIGRAVGVGKAATVAPGAISGVSGGVVSEGILLGEGAGVLAGTGTAAGTEAILAGGEVVSGGTAAGGVSVAGTAAVGIGSYIGAELGEEVADIFDVDEEAGAIVGGIAGGAATGFAVGGPIGGVIGGIAGGLVGAVKGTVICSELHRQGFMSDEIRNLDAEYGGTIDREAYLGYWMLATPIVEKMRKSKLFTHLVAPFGLAAANEMAHRIKPEIKGSLLGKVILDLGMPLCRRYFKYRIESIIIKGVS